jgi:DDE superfamily endonuclease
MSLIPTPSSSSSHSEDDDAKHDVLTAIILYMQLTLCSTMWALKSTNILRAPLLPHYKMRYIFEQMGHLTLEYVPSTSEQRQMDIYINTLHETSPPPSAFLLLCRNHVRFERMTRFSVAEFIFMYRELEPYILRPYDHYQQPVLGHRKRRIHPIDQLLLWIWHSDGNDSEMLGILFDDISRSTADRIADHVTRAVNDAWEEEVTWPDAEERRSLYGFFSSCETAVGVLDGTHCQISVPSINEGKFHSAYKNFHTQNYLICADALGFVTWTAGPYGGHDPDRAVFNTTAFSQFDCPLLSEGEVILVDGGFEGDGNIVHQFTQRELRLMSSEEQNRVGPFNEDFLHNRSPIEHCIHRVKNRAQALTKRWPRSLCRQGSLFTAATKVYNRCRRMRMEYALRNRK